MSVERMKMVNISGDFSKLDEASVACLMTDCFQPENTAEYLSESLHNLEKLSSENPYKQPLERIKSFMSVSGIEPKIVNTAPENMSAEQCESDIAALEDKFGEIQNERTRLEEEIKSCREECEQLQHFTGIDVKIHDIFDCEFIAVRFGRLPAESYKMLDMYADNPNVLFVPFSNDRDYYWGMYTAPKSVIDDVDRIFAVLFFQRVHIPDAVSTADEAIAEKKARQEKAGQRIKEIDATIKEYWQNETEHLLTLYSILTSFSQAFEIKKHAVRHIDHFVLIGWIPLSKKPEFEKALSKVDTVRLTFTDTRNVSRVQPPTLLKNPRLFNSYEFYIKMFGVPKYGEFDPTVFVAITYTLLYGIMFADVGQGIVLSIVGWLMYKLKKMDLGRLLIPCGISGAFFGLVFGSVFGFEEVLNPLYNALGFKNGKPINVMASDSTMSILIFAIVIGVVLMLMALGLNIFSKLKQHDRGQALFSANGLAGFILYSGIIVTALGMVLPVPSALSKAAVFMIAIPAVVLLLSEPLIKLVNGDKNWQPESWGGYLVQAFFEVFESLLSYLTNTVSFLRVGAFVLVHASMMMVFFNLAEMLGGVGYYIMIVFGNVFVLALEGLLVGVQSLRLEFYEMFNRFYEGSGVQFAPVTFVKQK